MAKLLLVALCLIGAGALSAQFGDENYLEATTQPATGNVQQGATQRHCLSFALMRWTSNSDTFQGLTVRNTGTAQAADYAQIQLWWDANDNDVFEPSGPDTVVGSAPSGAFPRTLTSMTPQGHAGLSVYNYFVTVDVAAGASIGRTFILEVTVTDVVMLTYPVVLFATPPVGTTQTITAGAAGGSNQIVVTQQPGGAQPATAFTTQPVVELRTSAGALLSGDSTTVVTAAITAGTGASGAVLGPAGSLTAQASGGVVTFSGLTIDLTGANYTLTFTATNFADGTSAQFDVGTPPTPTQLGITTQPGGAAPGVAFATQPVVQIQDSTGALVTTASHFVAVSLNGGSGGTLSGTLIVQAVNGVATFTDLSINQAGTGYSLTFSAVNLTSATSNSFDVAAPGGGSTGGGGGGGGGGGCSANTEGNALWLLGLLAAAAGTFRTTRRRA